MTDRQAVRPAVAADDWDHLAAAPLPQSFVPHAWPAMCVLFNFDFVSNRTVSLAFPIVQFERDWSRCSLRM